MLENYESYGMHVRETQTQLNVMQLLEERSYKSMRHIGNMLTKIRVLNVDSVDQLSFQA